MNIFEDIFDNIGQEKNLMGPNPVYKKGSLAAGDNPIGATEYDYGPFTLKTNFIPGDSADMSSGGDDGYDTASAPYKRPSDYSDFTP